MMILFKFQLLILVIVVFLVSQGVLGQQFIKLIFNFEYDFGVMFQVFLFYFIVLVVISINKWFWGKFFVFCKFEFIYEGFFVYDMEVYEVIFVDCSQFWYMCCYNGLIMLVGGMINVFGFFFVGIRDFICYIVGEFLVVLVVEQE